MKLYSKQNNAMLVFALLAAFFGGQSAHATTYYVSPTGNDANSGLSQNALWQTIDRGDYYQTLTSGDTVVLLPGTYDVSSGLRYVTNGVHLTLRSNGVTYVAQGVAIVDRKSVSGSAWRMDPGCNGVTLDGITFEGGEYDLWIEGAPSNTFRTATSLMIHTTTPQIYIGMPLLT